MIHISERASIGLHSMAVIAAAGGRLVSAGEIARITGASHAHLAKTMQTLVRAGLLRSVRGPQGGFALARPAADITLLQVYEAVEGKLNRPGCLLHCAECPLGLSDCLLGDLLDDLSTRTYAYLSTRTLADLMIKKETEVA